MQEKYVSYVSKKIITPHFSQKFIDFMNFKSENKYFSDLDVYAFLKYELLPSSRLTRSFRTRACGLYDDIMLDNLKDIFIYNLLKKKYISASEVDSLTQLFKIKEKSKYYDYGF